PPATAALYTLSLHDALTICRRPRVPLCPARALSRLELRVRGCSWLDVRVRPNAAAYHSLYALDTCQRPRKVVSVLATSEHFDVGDRKSTRLNSCDVKISYAV